MTIDEARPAGRPRRGGGRADLDPAIDAAIGDLIRHARKAAGLSQRQLAQALGVSYQQIARWEGGQARLHAATLVAIAAAADTNPCFLLPSGRAGLASHRAALLQSAASLAVTATAIRRQAERIPP